MAGQKPPRYGFGAPEQGEPRARYGYGSLGERFDIVNKYAWTTVAKNSQLRAEAPNAFVTGYELDKSQFQQFIEGYLNIGAQIIKESSGASNWDPGRLFYKNLYKPSTDSKISFNFPYFDNNIRSFSNNFDDTFSKVSSRGAQFGGSFGSAFRSTEQEAIGIAAAAGQSTGLLRSVAEAAGPGNMQNVINSVGDFTAAATGGSQSGMTGTYIETPKFYQYENTDAPLAVRFILANTIDEGDAEANLKFIRRFTEINRPKRHGPIEMSFPYIYHIEVPCQRYIEWAFLQDLQIELLGTKRKIQNRGGGCTIVPEAYGCTFQFKSLTVEAANFMADDLLCGDNCAFEDYIDKQATSDTESEVQLRAQKKAQEEAIKVEWGQGSQYTGAPRAEVVKYPEDPRTGRPVGEVNIIPRYGPGNPYWKKQYEEEKRNNPDMETYLNKQGGDQDGDGVNDWLQNAIETSEDKRKRFEKADHERYIKEGQDFVKSQRDADLQRIQQWALDKQAEEDAAIKQKANDKAVQNLLNSSEGRAREARQPYKGGGINPEGYKRDPGLKLPDYNSPDLKYIEKDKK